MRNKATAVLMAALLVCLSSASAFALEPYAQDFDMLNAGDTAALANDGWLVFGNVFGLDWAYWYGYGVFSAPNDGGGFCTVGVDGANQFLNVFSDYNNTDHPIAYIEANVFQEQMVGPGDVGETWVFQFDAMLGNLVSPTTALAFIKTLDPNAGYATTNFITLDMTNIGMSWGTYSISIFIDGSLDGQILQIGFANTTTNYAGSGVFYDNINFSIDGVIPADDTTWGDLKSLYR
jgi:hypothetical protein